MCMLRNQSRIRRTGISMVEIVVVLIVIGILMAAAVPTYLHALARARVDAAARRILADLQFVEKNAEISSVGREILFSPATGSYTVQDIASLDEKAEPYRVSLTAAPYATKLISADCDGDEKLIYDGFGRPDSAATIVVRSGSQQRTIHVDAMSGKAEIQ